MIQLYCGDGKGKTTAAVGAAVVNEQYFEITESLRQQAIHTSMQIFLRLVDGDNNRYGRNIIHGASYLLENPMKVFDMHGVCH